MRNPQLHMWDICNQVLVRLPGDSPGVKGLIVYADTSRGSGRRKPVDMPTQILGPANYQREHLVQMDQYSTLTSGT